MKNNELLPEALLAQYLIYKEQQKALEKEINHLKNTFISFGTFSTENYVCAIIDQSRISIKPLQEVVKVMTYDLLEEYDLIQNSTFKIVKISKKVETLAMEG